jgi:hypothetical protein
MPQLKWFLYHFQSGPFTALDWVVTFSGAIYALLAFVAYRERLPAALVGAALYAGLLVLQGAAAIRDALVIKVLVVSLLAAAVVLALKKG